MKHDPLPIRSPNHHGTDRRFYRAVPEQEDEAVKPKMILERHSLFGKLEEIPFGYLSYKAGYPVLQIEPVLQIQEEELNSVALKAAASLDMFDALERIVAGLKKKNAFDEFVSYGEAVLAQARGRGRE